MLRDRPISTCRLVNYLPASGLYPLGRVLPPHASLSLLQAGSKTNDLVTAACKDSFGPFYCPADSRAKCELCTVGKIQEGLSRWGLVTRNAGVPRDAGAMRHKVLGSLGG